MNFRVLQETAKPKNLDRICLVEKQKSILAIKSFHLAIYSDQLGRPTMVKFTLKVSPLNRPFAISFDLCSCDFQAIDLLRLDSAGESSN